MTNFKMRRALGALFALMMACAGLTMAASPAQAAEATFKVVTANLASNHINVGSDGVFAGYGTSEDPTTFVNGQIAGFNPDAVTVQEACYTDYKRLKALRPGWHFSEFYVMHGWYVNANGTVDTANGPSCDKGYPASGYSADQGYGPSATGTVGELLSTAHPKGQFIMSPHPIVFDSVLDLPVVPTSADDTADGQHKNRNFRLGCVDLAWNTLTTVCTTHLPTGKKTDDDPRGYDSKVMAVDAITGHLNHLAASSRPTVLTGDFNLRPKDRPMDFIYRVKRDGSGMNYDGKFWEADMEHNCTTAFKVCRQGAPTIGSHKIDYIFFGHGASKNRTSVSGMTLSNPTSDHKLLRGLQVFQW